jgi:hypothetical protein
VELTDAGRRQEREMRAAAAVYTERTFARLPAGERRELARLLDKLSDSIAEVAADRRAAPSSQPSGPVVPEAPP